MKFLCRVTQLLSKKQKGIELKQKGIELKQKSNFILTKECVNSMTDALRPSLKRKHEGIVYLLGLTNGTTTLATNIHLPRAHTTKGSFKVCATEISSCIDIACEYGLQVVGQVHTHPGDAYHSKGDEVGAKIRYTGYVSLVIPEYGKYLPKLKNSACYMWQSGGDWLEINVADQIVIPDEL